MAATAPHKCNETCVCNIHGTPMWYSPATDDHACQDPDCIWAGGVNAALDWMQERENEVWTAGQFAGIPRCVMFPYGEPCCGQVDADGNLTGFCPPPRL
jgi:hypothetical protein